MITKKFQITPIKSTLSLLTALLFLSAVVVSACGLLPAISALIPINDPSNDQDETNVEVKDPDPKYALEIILDYVRTHHGQIPPAASAGWSQELISLEGIVGSSSFRYTSAQWVVTVSFSVVAPDAVIYHVTASDQISDFLWLGLVNSSGEVTELKVSLGEGARWI